MNLTGGTTEDAARRDRERVERVSQLGAAGRIEALVKVLQTRQAGRLAKTAARWQWRTCEVSRLLGPAGHSARRHCPSGSGGRSAEHGCKL